MINVQLNQKITRVGHPGFTLIEVLVVTALAVILILVGSSVFFANSKFYTSQSGRVSAVNAVREAADQLNNFVRTASVVEATWTYNSVPYTTGTTLTVLRVPSLDASWSAIAGSYDHVIFGKDPQNASRLILIVDPAGGSARAGRVYQITDKLSAITLAWDNVDLAQAKNLTYTISVTETGQGSVPETVYGAATLRN